MSALHPPPSPDPNAPLLAPTAQLPVRVFADAIPAALCWRLANAFAPGAAYWRETDYDHRGYFGFWYDVAKPPTNAVECLIRHLLPLTGCEDDVVGAEWWVNTRLAERDMGHQLHFDTDADSISTGGLVPHPMYSSVVYLTGAGGPTIVLDQRVDGAEAQRGWLCRPRARSALLFAGDRLHGVLPLRADPADAGKPACQRLTLMVGFWGWHMPGNAPREPLGPCGPLPNVGPNCTWPQSLACSMEDFPSDGPAMPLLDAVEEVSPVWEDLGGPGMDKTPALSTNVDMLFFARDHSDWSCA